MENSLNLISVIIPVYNVEKYLARCINSVVNQTYKHLEIVLVDDGSTDGSAEICDQYAHIDNRIKVVHKSNAGLVSARNKGLDIITGDFVSFVDGDDYLEIRTYKEIINILIKYNVDVVKYGMNRIENNENIIKIHSHLKTQKYEYDDKILLLNHIIKNDGIDNSVSNCLFKKTIIDQYSIRTPEGIIQGEDLFFLTKYLLCSQSIFFAPRLNYYNYIQNASSLTKKYTDKYIHDIINLIYKFLELIENSGQKNFYFESFVYRVNKLIFYVLFIYTDFKVFSIRKRIEDLKYFSNKIPIDNKLRNRNLTGIKGVPVFLFNKNFFLSSLLVTWVLKTMYLAYKKYYE